MLQRGTFSFVYLHRFWFTMRASSAGWCFAFLKIPHQILDSKQIEGKRTLNTHVLGCKKGDHIWSRHQETWNPCHIKQIWKLSTTSARMPCFAGTLTYCLYQKAQFTFLAEPHPTRPLPPASFYPFSASCLALYPCYRLGFHDIPDGIFGQHKGDSAIGTWSTKMRDLSFCPCLTIPLKNVLDMVMCIDATSFVCFWCHVSI